jgi:hypothetical protein
MGQAYRFCPMEIYHMQAFDTPGLDQTGTQILHSGSRALFRYWESIRAERACPLRSEFDLRQITSLVPDLTIIEKNRLKANWEYRLAGTRVGDLFQHSLTGTDALAGWDRFERDVISRSLDISYLRLQPYLVRMRLITQTNQIIAAEMIGLPILAETHGPVQIIGGVFPFLDQSHAGNGTIVRRELVSARMIWTEHEQGDTLLDAVGRVAQPQLRVIQGGLK